MEKPLHQEFLPKFLGLFKSKLNNEFLFLMLMLFVGIDETICCFYIYSTNRTQFIGEQPLIHAITMEQMHTRQTSAKENFEFVLKL